MRCVLVDAGLRTMGSTSDVKRGVRVASTQLVAQNSQRIGLLDLAVANSSGKHVGHFRRPKVLSGGLGHGTMLVPPDADGEL